MLALRLAYDGTNYFGWAKQPDKVTIEGEIIRILQELNLSWKIQAMSRTDRGAHAIYQVISCNIPSAALNLINKRLPRDIKIVAWAKVPFIFHPRKSVIEKTYLYVAPDFGEKKEKIREALEIINSRKWNYVVLSKNPDRNTRMQIRVDIKFKDDEGLQFFLYYRQIFSTTTSSEIN